MHRIDWTRFLGLVIVLALAGLFFTASSGGVQAQAIPSQVISSQTHSPASELAKKPTKTPTATKTRKPKRTKTPTATPTESPVPTETVVGTETPTPTETATVSETPVATETATAEPSATPTRKRKKTRTPTPLASPTVEPSATATPTTQVNEAFVRAEQGGSFAFEDGAIRVNIPARAFAQDARLKFKRQLNDSKKQRQNARLVVNRFSLQALTDKKVKNKKNQAKAELLTEFDQDLTIEIEYDPAQLGNWQEHNLLVVYWDETEQDWLPLPTIVDDVNHLVIAETNHFTDFGLADAPDVQSYIPNLEGFQTNLFSGAAGYSYPLQVPPGRGGLTPNLSLSYSSTSMDMLNSNAQVSYLGAGWGFDTGYVARDTRNTFSTSDDVYSIVLNGASYDLILGADGLYHTGKEQYWKVTFQNNKWTVVTNDGTTYIFGDSGATRAIEWRRDQWENVAKDTYTWWLSTVTDVHNNGIAYTYKQETDTTAYSSCTADADYDPVTHPYVTAMYPKTITYNGGLTQIVLSYSARDDWDINYPAQQCGPAPVQKSKLFKIEVNTDDGAGLKLARKYQMSFDYSTHPGVPSQHSGTTVYGRLTLVSVTQYGSDDVSALPPITFDYTKGGRLKTATNGIGGTVSFTFDEVDVGNYGDEYDQDYSTWCSTNWCSVPSYAFWKAQSAGRWEIKNDPKLKKALYFLPKTSPTVSYLYWKVDPFTPGANYVMTTTLVGAGPDCSDVGGGCSANGSVVQLRLSTDNGASETNLTNWLTIPAGTRQTIVTPGISFPDNAKNPQIRLYAKQSPTRHAVWLERTVLQPQATHHRVETKTVNDGMTPAVTYNYDYIGPAVNDAAHSQAAQQCCTRHARGSQFRGHAQVNVMDPQNNVTENYFYQDDLYTGKAWQVIQKDANSNLYTQTQNEFGFTSIQIAANPPVNGDRIDFIKTISTTLLTYDGNNAAAPRRKMTQFGYDTFGNVNATYEYSGTVIYRQTQRTYAYNTTKNILNKVSQSYLADAGGSVKSKTQFLYDDNTVHNAQTLTKGDLTETIVFENGARSFTSATMQYDGYGNVTDVWDALGNQTHTNYDPVYQMFPVSVTNAKGHPVTTQYNYLLGRAEMVTDANDARTRTEFDVFGRPLKIFAEGEYNSMYPTAQYDYFFGSAGTPSRVHAQVRSDLGGNNPQTYQHAWWFYDGRGRTLQKQTQGLNGQTILVNTKYNALGQPWYVSNPYAISGYDPLSAPSYRTPDWNQPYTANTYDALGRLTRVDSPGIPVPTLYTYDHGLTTITDANGNKKDALVDLMGRTMQVREYENNALYATTNYAYDYADRLLDTWDAAGNHMHIVYDWLGRKTTMQDPDMGSWSYSYDNAGNLTQQRDAKNESVCFEYDALNRLATKTARAGTDCINSPVSYSITYGYDDTTNGNKGKGKRTSMTDATGNTKWRYALDGRALTTIQTIDTRVFTTTATSDAMGRVRATTYPDNEVVNQTYNAQGLLATLGSYVSASNYNAAGQLTSMSFGNRLQTTYGYDSQNLRLMSLQTSGSNQNLAYTYDNVGNVKTITDLLPTPDQVTTFNYDDLNRLKDATLPGMYSQAWNYNAIGNMTTFTDGGNAKTYSYTDAAHKHAVTQVGSNYFCYDANGNMVKRNATTSACTDGDALSYDLENRLTFTTVAGVTTNYAYNGDGARVKKVANGVTTYYVGNLYEYTTWTGGSSVSKYYYFGSQRIAVKQDISISYIHGDHLGSTSKTTGASASTQTYYPYGAIKTSSGTPPTDYGYTGQKRDASANLMYYGARYYDPALARFIQPDTIVPSPMDPQSLNRYSYVRNNPVNFADPSGHEEEPPCQSWDNYCWEKRYYEAQGLCLNERTGEWARACAPTINDPEMLGQVAATNPGIFMRPDLQLNVSRDQMIGEVYRVAVAMRDMVQNGAITSLEAMARIAGFGATLLLFNGFGTDMFVNIMTEVINGFTGDSSSSLLFNRAFGDDSAYHVGGFTDTGFHPDFQDGGNQVHHFWFFAALAYWSASDANLGAWAHESVDPFATTGRSMQDWRLSVTAIYLGVGMRQGNVSLNGVGTWMRNNLSAPFRGCPANSIDLAGVPICIP